MRRKGARALTVTAVQALTNQKLLGGPLRLLGWSLNDGTASQGLTVDQSAAAPGAGVTVASISLGNGQYQVEWTLEITGTPGAGDVDNVQVIVGATLIATSVNPGAVGNYSQEEVNAVVVFGPVNLMFKAIGAATAGSTYKVEANITPLTGATATIFDGAQIVGSPGMPPAGSDTKWIGPDGVQVDTAISVQTILGNVQGVLWYLLDSDVYDDPDGQDRYGG